jgi:hypothetical protein
MYPVWTGNHLHILLAAASNEALSRAMKGFLVSCAKRLNKLSGRCGRVFADRFHTRTLATPTAVRNAIRRRRVKGCLLPKPDELARDRSRRWQTCEAGRNPSLSQSSAGPPLASW